MSKFSFGQLSEYDSLSVVAGIKFSEKQYVQAGELYKKISNIKNKEKNELLFAQCLYRTRNFEKAFSITEKLRKNNPQAGLYLAAKCKAGLSVPKESCKYLAEYLKTLNKLYESQIKSDTVFRKIENSSVWVELWKKNMYSSYERKLETALYEISRNNPEEAYDILNIIIQENGKKHKALYMRAEFHFSKKNYKFAEEDFTKALKLRKFEKYYQGRAETYIKLQKYKKAKSDLEELLKTDNFNLDYKYKLSLVDFNLQNYKTALSEINFLIKFCPENDTYRFLKGKIYFEMQDYMPALKEFNKCVKSPVQKADYFEALADTYAETQSYEYADKNYAMALDLKPNSGKLYYKKANILYLAGNKSQACYCWQKAVSYKYYKASDKIEIHCEK